MCGFASRLVLAAILASIAVMSPAAWSQQPSPGVKKPVIAPQTQYSRKRVFTGTEIILGQMNVVRADCSVGPIPDVRILTPAANGEVRTEEIRYIVDRPSTNNRHHCNGKEVGARGIFYKSRAEFIGEDSVLVEVDFKMGLVRRYFWAIDVR